MRNLLLVLTLLLIPYTASAQAMRFPAANAGGGGGGGGGCSTGGCSMTGNIVFALSTGVCFDGDADQCILGDGTGGYVFQDDLGATVVTINTSSDTLGFINGQATGDVNIDGIFTADGAVTLGDAAGDTTTVSGTLSVGSTSTMNGVVTINTAGGTNAALSETGIDRNSGSAETYNIQNSGAGAMTLQVDGSTVWNAGNDGAGSGLDADLLDGLSSTAFCILSGSCAVVGSLSTDGNLTAGNASGDTVTFNAATHTYANDTAVTLSGGVNGLNFASDTLSIDAAGRNVGLGTAAPFFQLDILESNAAGGGTRARIANTSASGFSGWMLSDSDGIGTAQLEYLNSSFSGTALAAANTARLLTDSNAAGLLVQVDAGSFVVGMGGSGAGNDSLRISSTNFVVNEAGNDANFRVDTDTDTNPAFFVDGTGTGNVCIGVAAASCTNASVFQSNFLTLFGVNAGMGRINITAADAANPVFAFTDADGDANSGMYAPAQDQIGWSIDGVQRMLLNSSGITLTGLATDITAASGEDVLIKGGASTGSVQLQSLDDATDILASGGAANAILGTSAAGTNSATFMGNSSSAGIFKVRGTATTQAILGARNDKTAGQAVVSIADSVSTTSDGTNLWQVFGAGLIVEAPLAATCADSGTGAAGTLTLDITASYIQLTNNDANGCVVTVSEASAIAGGHTEIVIISNAGGTVDFADQAGILEMSATPYNMDLRDSLSLRYAGTLNEWLESSRSNN